MSVENGRICGRGVLALHSWEPLRRPGSVSNLKPKDHSKNPNSNQVQQIPTPPNTRHGPNPTLLAKYSYQAKPDQPGGFPEMTVKQGQKVQFLEVHPEQSLWWHVREQNGGNTGYVPASYMLILDDKPSSLPWLENKRLEEKKKEQSQPKNGMFANTPVIPWKPYVSAYSGGSTTAGPGQVKQYYCEVCDKQLNGPKPYQAHMVSKAHKNELEAQGLS